MTRVLVDTSVYVDYFRDGRWSHILEDGLGHAVVHLSAVVASELLVGAPNERAVRFMEGIVDSFDTRGRLEVPMTIDWLRAGNAIRRVGRQHSYEQVGRARLTNDALIAAMALRIGATILTRNSADFALLHDHIPASVLGL